MSRLSNTEVINDRLDGVGEIHSGAEHAEALGRADVVICHIKISGITAASGVPKLNVDYLHGNDGRVFLGSVSLVNDYNLTVGATFETVVDTGSAHLGAYGRVAVTIDTATSPSAHVRVIACGRTR